MEWRLGVSHDMEDLRKSSESPWCAWLAFPFQLYDNLAITRHSEHNWQNGIFQMKIWSRVLNLESRWKFESENPIREDTNGESLKTVLAVKRWKTLERENYSLNTFSFKWTQYMPCLLIMHPQLAPKESLFKIGWLWLTTRYIKNKYCFVNKLHWTTSGADSERRNIPNKGCHPFKKVQFFLTLFKRPLTPPPFIWTFVLFCRGCFLNAFLSIKNGYEIYVAPHI